MALDSLPDTVRRNLLDGVARGRYNLLLGAGASIGATGGDGIALTNSTELARDIATEFDFAHLTLSLRDSYEYALGRQSRNHISVDSFLRERFSNCIPSWQAMLGEFRWHRIWTLNIDDVMQKVYAHGRSRAGQRLATYHWADRFTDPELSNDELQIVHLHGFAPNIGSDNGEIVFSLMQYIHAVSKNHVWHRIFHDSIAEQPFIVVGTRFADEWDMAEALEQGC